MKNLKEKILNEVLENFDFQGKFIDYKKYGSGHINTTFLFNFSDLKYIVQKVNINIFKDPIGLTKNIYNVTKFLKEKIIKKGGDPKRETLNLLKTKNNEYYFIDSENEFWRSYLFIENTISYDKIENSEIFYESGLAFGEFQNLLSDYPVENLIETIPNFHNTIVRYENFKKSIQENKSGRVNLIQEEIDFALKREEEGKISVLMEQEGKLPTRVTHNDTKLNNILIDTTTKKGICVVDLDTIMPGVSINDFGDSIRFGANTALEDETDLSKVTLSLELFEAYTKGFLEGTNKSLTKNEIEMLPMSAKIMTLECGLRFLTDYIDGDIYFNIEKEHHNLDRARNQFKLVEDMELKFDEMKKIVDKYK